MSRNEVTKMKQLSLVYQEPITESPITHTATQKKSRYKLSKLGEQRLYSLILLIISIVVTIISKDLTLSVLLIPLAIGLLFSKKVHIN